MSRPLSIVFPSLLIFGIVQLSCQVHAQSPKTITNSIGMKLVLIPKGTFKMDGYQNEVTISKDYYVGVYEVTQGQYEKLMNKKPSFFQGNKVKDNRSNHPVEQVSWEEAVEFCKRMSELPDEKKAGRAYRLPTEAEWENACKAGSKLKDSFGFEFESLGLYAWYGENSKRQTHPVGEKKANAYGLYDMHGNVDEWCSDRSLPTQSVTDAVEPRDDLIFWHRGGNWHSDGLDCFLTLGGGTSAPSYRSKEIGFRLALTPPEIHK